MRPPISIVLGPISCVPFVGTFVSFVMQRLEAVSEMTFRHYNEKKTSYTDTLRSIEQNETARMTQREELAGARARFGLSQRAVPNDESYFDDERQRVSNKATTEYQRLQEYKSSTLIPDLKNDRICSFTGLVGGALSTALSVTLATSHLFAGPITWGVLGVACGLHTIDCAYKTLKYSLRLFSVNNERLQPPPNPSLDSSRN